MDLIKAMRFRRRSWLDTTPRNPTARNEYSLADAYVDSYASKVRSIWVKMQPDDDELTAMKKAIIAGDTQNIIASLPIYHAGDMDSVIEWNPVLERLRDGFLALVNDAAKYQAKYHSWNFKRYVRKSEEEEAVLFSIEARALRWVEKEAGSLIVSVSESVVQNVRDIVYKGFVAQKRVEVMAQEIVRSIPLLPKQVGALNKLDQLLMSENLTEEARNIALEKTAARMRNYRATNIARTETIRAYNEGRQSSWEAAQAEGLLPPNVIREWNAAPGSERTCPICMELHGKKTTMTAPFSGGSGEFMNPPAHPSCRCAVVLRFPED